MYVKASQCSQHNFRAQATRKALHTRTKRSMHTHTHTYLPTCIHTNIHTQARRKAFPPNQHNFIAQAARKASRAGKRSMHTHTYTHTHIHRLAEKRLNPTNTTSLRRQLEKRLAKARSAERNQIVQDLQQAMAWARSRRAQLAAELDADRPCA